MSKIAVILALPIEYNTSSMIRCRAVIQALGSLGNRITCYCPNPDITHKYYGKNCLDLSEIEIVRFKKRVVNTRSSSTQLNGARSLRSVLKGLVLTIIRKIDIFGSSIRYVSERKWISNDINNRKFDILISFSEPKTAHIMGGFCKRRTKIQYIQQWGDPLADDITNKSILPVWVKKKIETNLLKTADKICYVSPFTLKSQAVMYQHLSHKMMFLPTPSIDYDNDPRNTDLNTLSFGYFGSYHSIARDIMPFYNAAKKNGHAEFYIIGDSDVELKGTDHIHIIRRVEPSVLNEYMKKVNVIVCLMNKRGGQIPGKVYHDASSSKDILLIKDGEYGDGIQEFFEKYEHYTFVDNDTDSIDLTIKNYLKNGVPIRKPVEEFKSISIARQLIEN